MARASFTLRKETSPDYGSYLQYPPSYDASASAGLALRTDDDVYLKGDGVQVAPVLGVENAYFTVEAVDYSEVYLKWGVSLASTLTTTPQATEVLIAYSDQGEPSTISEGVLLVETTTDSDLYHDAPSGSWAYYSLFLKYESSTGDLYYERAASLSILLPNNYGSTDLLYRKIPLYYRELDDAQNSGSGGPLYRFLSVIGFDVDRMRTLIDYLMVCKDPQEASDNELDVLAQDLGLDMASHELGAARLRAILNDIGYIRRRCGTPAGIEATLSAITGSYVDVVGSPTFEIRVRPQRVNLVKDPRLTSGLSSSLDGGGPSSTTTSTADAGVYNDSQVSTYDGGTPSETFAGGTGYWSSSSDPTTPGVTILEANNSDVVIAAGDVFYASVHTPAQEFVTEVSLDNTTVSPREAIAFSTTPLVIGGRYYWKLEVPSNWVSPSTAALRIKFTSQTSEVTEIFDSILLEQNNIGDYFDGDTVRGGWVVDGGGSISDYQWYDPTIPGVGTANDSFSMYNNNFQKTKAVVNRLIGSILPVNQLVTSGTVYSHKPISIDKYTLVYNYLPGY